MRRALLAAGVVVLVSGCFPSLGDVELETTIHGLVSAKTIAVVDNLDVTVINIESGDPFTMTTQQQVELSRTIAGEAARIDGNRRSIMVGFTMGTDMMGFLWQHNDGNLLHVETTRLPPNG